MELYITRHGQTDGNVYKIMDGIRDIELNEKGIEQAKKTRDILKDIEFDLNNKLEESLIEQITRNIECKNQENNLKDLLLSFSMLMMPFVE